MALVAHFDLELHQLDVKIAFQNGEMKRESYLPQHKLFEAKVRRV